MHPSGMMRWVWALSLAFVPAISARVPQADQVMEILRSAESGADIDVVFKDVGTFKDAFRRVSGRWIDDGAGDERTHRLDVVALAVLRLRALVGADGPGVNAQDLVDWFEGQWSKAAPSEFERLWRLVDLSQTCLYGSRAVSRADAASRRFPDESRFRLLGVLARRPAALRFSNRPGAPPELVVWTRMPCAPRAQISGVGNRTAALAQIRETIRDLEALAGDPVVGAEARLRTGVLRFHLNQLDEAIADLAVVVRTSDDPWLRYIANYVIGTAHDVRGDYDAAREAFEACQRDVPGAVTGIRQLAAHRALASALPVVDAPVDPAYAREDRLDPVLLYHFTEVRFLEARLERLQHMVRR